MDASERMALVEWAMNHAIKCGADQIALSISKSRNIDISYRDKKIEKLQEATSNSLSLQIYAQKRYSGVTTKDLKRENLAKFIEEAVANTKYLSEDLYRSLPEARYYEGREDFNLEINDSEYKKIESNQRVEIASLIEESALNQSNKIISTTAEYTDSYSESILMHSNGFIGERTATMFSAGAEVTVKDQNGGRPEDWFYAATRFKNDLIDPKIIGKLAADRALKKIGQKKIESGRFDMIVENRASGRLVTVLTSAMSARALQQKSSFLEGMLGKKVASEKLTIIDDPFIRKGIGSRLFDGEGLSAKKRVMIENGILKNFYVDNYYGKKIGLDPTSASSSNITFDYGNKNLEEMVKNVKRGILISEFLGGNSNSTTGDFSFGIVGVLIENGQITQPVNEMNISGNAKQFWNQLAEVGNDEYQYSSMRSPSMLFENVNFSGK